MNIFKSKMIIKLNVGGKLFETSMDTIRFSGYLTKLVEYEKGEIFIDRDPDMFEHILKHLRDRYYLPDQNILEDFYRELDFYCVMHKENSDWVSLKDEIVTLSKTLTVEHFIKEQSKIIHEKLERAVHRIMRGELIHNISIPIVESLRSEKNIVNHIVEMLKPLKVTVLGKSYDRADGPMIVYINWQFLTSIK